MANINFKIKKLMFEGQRDYVSKCLFDSISIIKKRAEYIPLDRNALKELGKNPPEST